MFWFIEVNVQCVIPTPWNPRTSKWWGNNTDHPLLHTCKSATLKLNDSKHDNSSSWGRWSDMIFMGRWNTNGSHAILSDFWLGINMAMEINQGPLFEACSSVVIESGGIRWKSRRCWTLTRLHTHRESDSFDCSHRNHCSITIRLGGMKVKCVYLLC